MFFLRLPFFAAIIKKETRNELALLFILFLSSSSPSSSSPSLLKTTANASQFHSYVRAIHIQLINNFKYFMHMRSFCDIFLQKTSLCRLGRKLQTGLHKVNSSGGCKSARNDRQPAGGGRIYFQSRKSNPSRRSAVGR